MSMTEVSREERLELLLRHAMSMIGEMVQRHPAALKQLRSRKAPAWIRDEENVLELAHVETERAAEVVDWIAEERDEGIFRTWREIRANVPAAPIPLFASYEAAVGRTIQEVPEASPAEDEATPEEARRTRPIIPDRTKGPMSWRPKKSRSGGIAGRGVGGARGPRMTGTMSSVVSLVEHRERRRRHRALRSSGWRPAKLERAGRLAWRDPRSGFFYPEPVACALAGIGDAEGTG